MARCQSHSALFVLGALAGAAATLLILPSTRRTLIEGVRSTVDELRYRNSLDRESITQEAGAVEGGLAGTRRWSESYSNS
ncbi:MAG TPA: hypothetical protein VKF80_11120 [Candidatus Eisenbacteria bacterium]|nr:hypothetical protein [Candidatus Eisenbacteria bacterium]